MRKLACLVGLVAASALVAGACGSDSGDPPPGTGATGGGGSGASGGGGGGASGGSTGGGGGSTVEPSELFGSGSRLEAMYLDGGQGAERFMYFNDSELGQTCIFAEADDGVVRCVPTRHVFAPFSDSNCTQRVAVVDACAEPPPAYVYYGDDKECYTDVDKRLTFEVGAAVSLSTIYIGNSSSCLEVSGWNLSGSTEYLLSPADPTVFAAATLTDIEVDGNLGQRVATTDDGAYQVLAAYDAARPANNCVPTLVGGATLCLGPMAISDRYSTSATCDPQNVAYYYETDGCGDPSVIQKRTAPADPCDPWVLTLYELGDEVEPTSVYEESGGNCSAVSSSEARFFEEGAAAPAGLVPVLSQIPLGAGRLQLDIYASPAGAPLRYVDNVFRDTARDEGCTARSLEDGSIRCLPGSREIGGTDAHYFSDAACTTEVLAVTQSACGTTPDYASFQVPSGCSTVIRAIHTVGAAFTGDVYEGEADGSNCVTPAVQPANLDFYQIGAEVPLADFVEITVETKPAS